MKTPPTKGEVCTEPELLLPDLNPQGERIDGLVTQNILPPELGGVADWSIEEYIAARCSEEGVCPDVAGGERKYQGRALDLAILDGAS